MILETLSASVEDGYKIGDGVFVIGGNSRAQRMVAMPMNMFVFGTDATGDSLIRFRE